MGAHHFALISSDVDHHRGDLFEDMLGRVWVRKRAQVIPGSLGLRMADFRYTNNTSGLSGRYRSGKP